MCVVVASRELFAVTVEVRADEEEAKSADAERATNRSLVRHRLGSAVVASVSRSYLCRGGGGGGGEAKRILDPRCYGVDHLACNMLDNRLVREDDKVLSL